MRLPIVNHEDYVAKINDDNKFPIRKFGELAKYLLNKKVVNEFYKPEYCSEETLSRAHSLEYINSIKNKTIDIKAQKKIGFPINDSVVNRSFRATGGTVLASKLAIDNRIACNTAGGSHHASYNEGAGYCVFNDVAVAAKYLQSKGYAHNILVVDLDVHQGNGTSEIFKKDRSVFTFSMHCKSNYPAKKTNGDLDVGLEDDAEDEEYLNKLKENILLLNKENYDFVFYVAGVDIHLNDRLGKLKVSEDGIKKRDEMIINNFFEKNIPICGVLGGGYNKDFETLVRLHAILHKTCASII
tara:strand:- start:113 stop:1006 length:894 start_codon:yes stop_codon:yes gene_type:complete